MDKKYTVYTLVASLVAFVVVFYTSFTTFTSSPLSPSPSVQLGQPAPASDQNAASSSAQGRQMTDPRSVRIVVGSATYVGSVSDGTTVLETMQLLRSEGLTFDGREYPSLGYFVETINGKKAAPGYVWILYVNGKEATQGASAQSLHPGDVVEWRYEKSH